MIRVSTDKVLIVDGYFFAVNSTYLSACSPVFASMFKSDMLEAQNNDVELKEIKSAELFGDFLAAISPRRIRPTRIHLLYFYYL